MLSSELGSYRSSMLRKAGLWEFAELMQGMAEVNPNPVEIFTMAYSVGKQQSYVCGEVVELQPQRIAEVFKLPNFGESLKLV